MPRNKSYRTVLIACVAVAGIAGNMLFGAGAAAQMRSMPMFEVDPAWPKLADISSRPTKWRIEAGSSAASRNVAAQTTHTCDLYHTEDGTAPVSNAIFVPELDFSVVVVQ